MKYVIKLGKKIDVNTYDIIYVTTLYTEEEFTKAVSKLKKAFLSMGLIVEMSTTTDDEFIKTLITF